MKFIKTVSLLLILVMSFTLVACGNDKKDVETPIAKVGNLEITQDELDQYTYLYCFIQGVDLSSVTEENLEYIKTMMLEDLISLNIMKIYYEGNESILPEDYQESADKFIETVESQEAAKTYMKKYKVTNQALKDFFISQYYSVAFFDELEAGLPGITDEEIKAYFDKNQDQFKIDEVTAKHILVEEEELAKEILAKLKGGADFAEMAAQYGTDSTAQNGGDLGTFGRNKMDPEFEKAAFALKPGELSDVVKTQFGYHIIYLVDKKQGTETFENVKDTIRANLENEALSQAYTAKIKDLREEAGVEYLSE